MRHQTLISGMIIVGMGCLFTDSAQAAGCSIGEVQVGEWRDETQAGLILVRPYCQSIPSLHPGYFVSEASYQSALADCAKLIVRKKNLVHRLANLERAHNDLETYLAAIEAARQETWRGEMSDILKFMKFPISEALKKVTGSVRYAKYFAAVPNFEANVSRALEAEIGMLNVIEGLDSVSAGDKNNAVKKISTGVVELVHASAPVPVAEVKLRKWLDGVRNLLKVGIITGTHDMKNPTSQLEAVKDMVPTVTEAAGVFYPPVGFGVEASKVIVAGYSWTADDAIEDLKKAANTQWGAEVSLRDKIQQIDGFIREQHRTTSAYAALHHLPQNQSCPAPAP